MVTKTFPNRTKCKLTAMPQDLTGKTVLDVGGYDGYMAKIALERGAKKAIVVDNAQYQQYIGYNTPTGLDGVDYVSEDILGWDQPAEIVLCYDVLYHSKIPYYFLEHLYKLTQETLCLSTRIIEGAGMTWEAYGPFEEHPDPTVFWKPTRNALFKLLNIIGFDNVRTTFYDAPGSYEKDGLIVVRCDK